MRTTFGTIRSLCSGSTSEDLKLELKDGDVIVGALHKLLPGARRFVRRGIAKAPDGRLRENEEFFDKQQ